MRLKRKLAILTTLASASQAMATEEEEREKLIQKIAALEAKKKQWLT